MAHYDEFYANLEETARKSEELRKDRQKACKHQWTMHEVTLEGSPVSVICMHCDKIHRIEKEPEVTFEPKVEAVSCQHSYKFMYRNPMLKTITAKCKYCGDVKELPEEV
ncbi:hypothetical protein [Morganella phage phiA020]